MRTLHNYHFVIARSEATWRSLQIIKYLWDCLTSFAMTQRHYADSFVKSRNFHFLSFRWKSESCCFNMFWMPVFTGMTILTHFTRPSIFSFL